MSKVEIKEADVAILIAAIQNSVGPIQVKCFAMPQLNGALLTDPVKVDAEKVARQLGMSLSTIPPKFSALRKKYHIDIKVLNSGALQRNRANTPKKPKSRSTPELARAEDAPSWAGESPVRGETRYTPVPIHHAQHYPDPTHGASIGFLGEALVKQQPGSKVAIFGGSQR